MSSTEIKRNGFSIVAGALPSHRPFVMVYTPNGTVAMNHYGDPYCTDVQEMLAVGERKVDFLCDFERLEPHHRELVARQSVEYIAKSFNISLDVAYGWKVVATMGMGNVRYDLFAGQWWCSTQIYESNAMSSLIEIRIARKPNQKLLADLVLLGQQLNNQR